MYENNTQELPKQVKINCLVSEPIYLFLKEQARKESERLEIKITMTHIVNILLKRAMNEEKKNNE